jgi:hypothetical protein
MRIHALTALAALALAAPARAQEPGDLPRDLAERITQVLNDPATERREGVTAVEAGRTVASDLAVLGGDLSLSGRVDGDVVVVNGNLQLADGAEVGGDVIVVGGEIAGEQEASVTGQMVVFDEPVSHCRYAGRLDVGSACGAFVLDTVPVSGARDLAADDARGGGRPKRGTEELILSPGRSYNRVEGLPIHLGGELATGGGNPLRVRAMGIVRTAAPESSSMGADFWGYDVRVEQFIGGYQAFRVGARAFSVVDPIEGWHLTDLENSLSTFVLHRDYRDHYAREGWSAYAMVTPPRSPVTVTAELLWEDHRSVAPASPWALLANERWRMQPLVAEGPLRALQGTAVIDTRSEAWDPSSGWYVRAELEHTLGSDLIRPTYVSTQSDAPFVVPSNRFGEYTRGLLDLRRYNRISPSQRLNLRIAVGGSMSVFPLPPQRQHALGGAGTLPGYGLFSLDCGARLYAGMRTLGRDDTRFFNGYGCDRFALFQAEYRGDISFRLPLTGSARSAEADDDEEAEDGGGWAELRMLDMDLNWVFFVDAGAGWTSLDNHHDEDAAIDVGAGILLGDLGVYIATPVHDVYDRGGVNFFIRLAPRF